MLTNKFKGQTVLILIKISLVSKQIFKSLTWKDCIFSPMYIYIPLWNSNLNVYRKDNNWLYLLFKTNFVPSPHTKFRLNKKMTNYNHFTSIDISKWLVLYYLSLWKTTLSWYEYYILICIFNLWKKYLIQ